tara:strand:- start:43 stop:669 length:627 start_codon:yes stop_codon:yes gene_type:complete
MSAFLLSPFLPQDPILVWVFLVLAAYLTGSIPFGVFVARMGKIGDIRKQGSGNIGATNMLRVGGKKLAFLTLILDGLKGAVPVLLAQAMIPEAAALCGLIAAAAHMFPVWLGFKGGKGVASFLGVMLALSLPAGIIIALAWLVFAFTFRYSSLSALAASALSPAVFYFVTGDNGVGPLIILVLLIWWRHRTNIARLMNKTEPRIGQKP